MRSRPLLVVSEPVSQWHCCWGEEELEISKGCAVLADSDVLIYSGIFIWLIIIRPYFVFVWFMESKRHNRPLIQPFIYDYYRHNTPHTQHFHQLHVVWLSLKTWDHLISEWGRLVPLALQKLLYLLRVLLLFSISKHSQIKTHFLDKQTCGLILRNNEWKWSEFNLNTSRIIWQWGKQNNLMSEWKQDYLAYPTGPLFIKENLLLTD